MYMYFIYMSVCVCVCVYVHSGFLALSFLQFLRLTTSVRSLLIDMFDSLHVTLIDGCDA